MAESLANVYSLTIGKCDNYLYYKYISTKGDRLPVLLHRHVIQSIPPLAGIEKRASEIFGGGVHKTKECHAIR